MQLDRFKHEFKRLNGVYATDKVVLFRNPLELYSLTTGKIIASFNSLDEALHFEIDGKTLEQRISAWTEITFPVEHGGRGGGSGIGFSGGWPSSGGGSGKDETTADLPARMNVKIGSNRVYEDMVRAFVAAHGDALEEHGVVVDEQGFATKYRHGWPTFSKEDVINTALGTRRGIVAVSTKTGRGDDTARYAGVYTFTKGTHFNASGFVKAVNSAQLSGKDYNDAVSKWLKANQQKFGYKYSYQKAK